MGTPIRIGALSTNAPPGETRSARGPQASDDRAGLEDRALIDAVRTGNLHAFGTLYERHLGAVRGLARRLCRNQADADDVVADVFTNTLRAIKSGRGPRDEMRSYVLTSTRHTVIKLYTRRDSGRAIPTTDEQLETATVDETLVGDDGGVDPISAAFVQLPDRFRNVLWLSCVDDMPPAEVGLRTALSPGAASSLTMRARRALARSYLVSRISQPIVSAACIPIRDLLPAVVRGEAAAATVGRVDRHLTTCCECNEAFGEMQSLAGSMRSFPWLAAALAWTRSLAARTAPEAVGGLGGAAGLAPVVVTAMALMTFTAGDAAMPTTRVAPLAVTPASAPSPVAAPATPVTVVAWPGTATSPSIISPLDGTDGADSVAASEPRATAALREAGVPSTSTLGVVQVVSPSDAPAVEEALDPLAAVVASPTAPLAQLAAEVDSSVDTRVVATGQLVDDVGDGVVSVLEDVGAGPVAPAVEPIVDTPSELLLGDLVQPVADGAPSVVVDSTSLVASTADDVLASIDRP